MLRNLRIPALVITLVFVISLVAAPTFAQQPKIGLIDVEKVFSSHPGLPAAQAQLQGQYEELQAGLEGSDNPEMQQMAQQELQQLEQAIQGALLAEIQEATEKVVEREGYDLVLVKDVVFVGGQDISDQIISELEN